MKSFTEKIKRTASVTIVVGVSLLAVGCGGGAMTYAPRRFVREARGIKYDAFAAQPPVTGFGAYKRLEVEPLQNQMEDQIPARLVASLNEQMLKQLKRVKGLEVVPIERRDEKSLLPGEAQSKNPFAGNSAAGTGPSAAAPRTMILRVEIVDFNAGKQSLRLAQVGVARQAVLTVHLQFADAATGQLLAKYVVNSEIFRLGTNSDAAAVKLSAGIGKLVTRLIEMSNAQATMAGSSQNSPNAGERIGRE